MYSVTFKNTDGQETFSHCFETVKAARNWVKWLAKQRFTTEVSLYRGQPGEELLCRQECAVKPLYTESLA